MPPGQNTKIFKKKKKEREERKTLKEIKNATKQNDSLGLGSSFLDPLLHTLASPPAQMDSRIRRHQMPGTMNSPAIHLQTQGQKGKPTPS